MSQDQKINGMYLPGSTSNMNMSSSEPNQPAEGVSNVNLISTPQELQQFNPQFPLQDPFELQPQNKFDIDFMRLVEDPTLLEDPTLYPYIQPLPQNTQTQLQGQPHSQSLMDHHARAMQPQGFLETQSQAQPSMAAGWPTARSGLGIYDGSPSQLSQQLQAEMQMRGFSQPQSQAPPYGHNGFDTAIYNELWYEELKMYSSGLSEAPLQYQSQMLGNIPQQSFLQPSQQSYPYAPPQQHPRPQTGLSVKSQSSSSSSDLAQSCMQPQPELDFAFGMKPIQTYCSLSLSDIRKVLGTIPPWINQLPTNVKISQKELLRMPKLVRHYPSFYFILTVLMRDIKVQDLTTRDLPPYLQSELSSFVNTSPNRALSLNNWLNFFDSLNRIIVDYGGRLAPGSFKLVELVKKLVTLKYIDSAFIYTSMTRAYEGYRAFPKDTRSMEKLRDFAQRISYVDLLSREQVIAGFNNRRRARSPE